MQQWAIGIGAAVVALPILVWLSHRMLTTSGDGGSGGADAFGAIVDVFEPARARADKDLESHNTMRQDTPTPGDDLGRSFNEGRPIRIRRPDG